MKILLLLIIMLSGCVSTYDYVTVEDVTIIVEMDYETAEFQLQKSR